MPCGRFVNGEFEITVTLDYNAGNQDLYTEWLRSLQKAAELFYNAMDGQLRIGRWLIANNSYGLEAAEVVMHAAGEGSYASLGGFGAQPFPGFLPQVHLMPGAKLNPMTVVHELAHQIFGVWDEYTGAVDQDDIVLDVQAESTTVIPIDNPERAGNALAGVYAGMRQGTLLERRQVTSSTENQVVVQSPFSFLPSEASPASVFYQDPSETCHEGSGANPDGYLCLMQESGHAGNFDAAGIWQPYNGTAPSTDFCSVGNHDPDGDTQQHVETGKSCWETIFNTMAERFDHPLNAPNPPTLAPQAEWSPSLLPESVFLAEERRIALVIDRSGSMNESDKMTNARAAAQYWVDRLRVEAALGIVDARLALISYNQSAQVHFALEDGTSLPDDIDDTIGDLQPSGWTNIRAALDTARGLLVPTPDDRAATQALLLLTDGVHNHPDGTSALDGVEQLRNEGVRVFSVGFGEGDDAIDMLTLEELGAKTCGNYPLQAADPDGAEILTELIYEMLFGGLVTSTSAGIAPAPRHAYDQEPSLPPEKRPPLEKLVAAFDLDVKHLPASRRQWKSIGGGEHPGIGRVRVIPALVEEGADRASFTLNFPIKQPLWLYLLAPDGESHPMGGSNTRVVSREGSEFAVVGKPMPGMWRIVAVRPAAGAAIDFHAFAGVDHRRLVVRGGSSVENPPGAPVSITAAAFWGDRLSGLKVGAHVIAPDGSRTVLKLSDDDPDDVGSGDYRAFYTPPFSGRYQGMIHIESTSRMRPAQMLHRLNHLHIGGDAGKVKKLEVPMEATRFVRVIPFSFWSGERIVAKDLERRR